MSSTNPLQIHLLFYDPSAEPAFKAASEKYFPSGSLFPFTVKSHPCSLSQLSPIVKFDLIASPANSYGLMDGGFDDAISRAMSPQNEYLAMTRTAQAVLRKECRGFLRPGMCKLVNIPDEWSLARMEEAQSRNVWGCRYLALCPTMRAPQNVQWDREIIYECVWSLLSEIEKHNRAVSEEAEARKARNAQAPALVPARTSREETKITSILMTPVATGAGAVSVTKWAEQLCLAMKHWVEEESRPEGKGIYWDGVQSRGDELAKTWNL